MNAIHAAGIFLSGVLAIWSKSSDRRRVYFVFKPLTMLLILSLLLGDPGPFSPPYRAFVLAGLLLSLAGDVFLMLPARWFLAGLVSFLLAHLAYIAAFTSVSGFSWSAGPLLIAALFGAVLVARLWPHLGRLKSPVLAYTAVIVTMFWQAAGLWLSQTNASSGLAALGALFFLVSDGALAWDRFGPGFKASPLVVLGTYYVAQSLLALSA